jgi:ABC-2 type transport system ATP-binding protein
VSAPAIEARGLVRRFGSFTAVNGLSLSVAPGTFYGFLGPNGAGKSTTMRLLTGLLAADSGEVLLEGRSVVAEPLVVRRRIGVLPDDLALFDRLSAWEHLTMAGPIYGLSNDDTARRAESLLRMLDLWDTRGTLAGDCSTGMKKKIALALALLHAPRLLFLDEPFEGIDPVSGRVIRNLLVDLAGRGLTIFLTSHILEIVERLATRIGIIHEGRLVVEIDRAELAARGQSLDALFAEVVGLDGRTHEGLEWLG